MKQLVRILFSIIIVHNMYTPIQAQPRSQQKLVNAKLRDAAVRGDVKKVQWALTHNASTATHTKWEWQPLHLAALGGHIQCVMALLRADAPTFTTTRENLSAYDIAMKYGHEATANLLKIWQQETTAGKGHPSLASFTDQLQSTYGFSSNSDSDTASSDSDYYDSSDHHDSEDEGFVG